MSKFISITAKGIVKDVKEKELIFDCGTETRFIVPNHLQLRLENLIGKNIFIYGTIFDKPTVLGYYYNDTKLRKKKVNNKSKIEKSKIGNDINSKIKTAVKKDVNDLDSVIKELKEAVKGLNLEYK